MFAFLSFLITECTQLSPSCNIQYLVYVFHKRNSNNLQNAVWPVDLHFCWLVPSVNTKFIYLFTENEKKPLKISNKTWIVSQTFSQLYPLLYWWLSIRCNEFVQIHFFVGSKHCAVYTLVFLPVFFTNHDLSKFHRTITCRLEFCLFVDPCKDAQNKGRL